MGYCTSLTNAQVVNVLCDEALRADENPTEVGRAALELYREAREECIRRGIEPDDELRAHGLRRPRKP